MGIPGGQGEDNSRRLLPGSSKPGMSMIDEVFEAICVRKFADEWNELYFGEVSKRDLSNMKEIGIHGVPGHDQ